jgi:hypothetical protein
MLYLALGTGNTSISTRFAWLNMRCCIIYKGWLVSGNWYWIYLHVKFRLRWWWMSYYWNRVSNSSYITFQEFLGKIE